MRRPRGLGTDIPGAAQHGTPDPSAPRPGEAPTGRRAWPPSPGAPAPSSLDPKSSSLSFLRPRVQLPFSSDHEGSGPPFPVALGSGPLPLIVGLLLSLTQRPGFLLPETSTGSCVVYVLSFASRISGQPHAGVFMPRLTSHPEDPFCGLVPRESQTCHGWPWENK